MDLVRGTPNSVLDPIPVHDVQIIDSGPRVKPPEEQVQKITETLREAVGLKKEFDADDAVNHEGLEEFLRQWNATH